MPFNIGAPEMIFLLVIVLIVFGAGRLPEVFGQIGKGVRTFREESSTTNPSPTTQSSATQSTATQPTATQAPSAPATRTCAKCANPLPAAAKFCPNCGTPI